MRQTSFAEFHCSLARSLDVMGDWWTPLILRSVYLGVDRFDDLISDLGISRNLLNTRIASLVEHDMLQRVQYSEHPPRDRFELTVKAMDLVPVLIALTAWGDRWETPPGGPPLYMRHDGHRCDPQVVCATCDRPLDATTLEPEGGPGGRIARGTAVTADRIRRRSPR